MGEGWVRVLSSSPLLCLAFSCIVRAACVSRDLGAAAQCLELFVRVAAMGRTDGRTDGEVHQNNEQLK